MIAVIFLFDSVPVDDLSLEQYADSCRSACEEVLFEVQSAGFLAITLSATDWVENVTSVSVILPLSNYLYFIRGSYTYVWLKFLW